MPSSNYPSAVGRNQKEKNGERPSILDWDPNLILSPDATDTLLEALVVSTPLSDGANASRLIPLGTYIVRPGELLIPVPSFGTLYGQGSLFGSVLQAKTTAPDYVLKLGDGTHEPSNFVLRDFALDANQSAPTLGTLLLDRINLIRFYNLTIQYFAAGGIGIGSTVNPALLGELIFNGCLIVGGDLNPSNPPPPASIGVRLYPTGNIDFEGSSVENVDIGLWLTFQDQQAFHWLGGHFERIGKYAMILENCQPKVFCNAVTGGFWLDHDVVNGMLELATNSALWTNGAIVDNGFGNRIRRTSSGPVMPGNKAVHSSGLSFDGDEWLKVENLNPDPTFVLGVGSWTPGASATLSIAEVPMPGVKAGRSLVITNIGGTGSVASYAEQTFTAAINTDYLVQVGILVRPSSEYRIIVLNSSGVVWDSGSLTYTLGTQAQSFKVIRHFIPVTSDTVLKVRIFSVDAAQLTICPLVLISRSQIRMSADYATSGTGFISTGSDASLTWTQETNTGSVYAFKSGASTGRGFIRAVVTMGAGKSGAIGVGGDGDSATAGPQAVLRDGTDIEYIIPVSALPNNSAVNFYSFSGVANSIVVREVGLFLINDKENDVTLNNIPIPQARQITSNSKGDNLSLRSFGAVGDTRVFSASVTNGVATIDSADADWSSSDVGKRVIIYGADSASGRKSWIADVSAAPLSTSSYTVAASLDCQGASDVKFAANSYLKDVTWEVFGSNASNFAGEVSVHGPTSLTALATSDSYTTASPSYRYYRAKIIDTVSGQHGVGYVSACALGYVLGTTILSVQSSTQATLSANCGTTRAVCYALVGTDDTVAIQNAIDFAFSRVTSGTADGGVNLLAPTGNYLFSSPINQKHCVTIRGGHGGSTIFYADGAAMPPSIPIWNMTGTFGSDSRIAFFTRLEDIRLDCGHVPGSVGVFCDALQENSGLHRCTIIKWLQYGVQASTAADQFGCANWMITEPWIYPSPSAFLDDTVAGLKMDYALDVIGVRGTIMGQGGYICGYGKAVDISHGNLHWYRLHTESARIGVHFNTGSGGILDGFDSNQGFVKTACTLDGGNPISIRNLATTGKIAIQDNLNVSVIVDTYVTEYNYSNRIHPHRLGGPLRISTQEDTYPNVVTLNPVNFGADYQGGFVSVNSQFSQTFPNWEKTSAHASNKAMFMRLAASAFEIMIGAANNSGGVDPGTRYLRVDDVLKGLFTPRLFFDLTGTGIGPLLFGNDYNVNQFRWYHGDTNQKKLVLQWSTNSGSSWTDVMVVDANAGTVTITGLVANSGVTSLIGTAHQVIASAATGAVTLSAPQDIDTSSSPTFANLLLGSGGQYKVNGTKVLSTQQPNVAGVSGSFGATWTAAEQTVANDLLSQFNTLCGYLRNHGIIAP